MGYELLKASCTVMKPSLCFQHHLLWDDSRCSVITKFSICAGSERNDRILRVCRIGKKPFKQASKLNPRSQLSTHGIKNDDKKKASYSQNRLTSLFHWWIGNTCPSDLRWHSIIHSFRKGLYYSYNFVDSIKTQKHEDLPPPLSVFTYWDVTLLGDIPLPAGARHRKRNSLCTPPPTCRSIVNIKVPCG